MNKKILIVDNSFKHKCIKCSQFHRHFSAKTSVLHSIEGPLPQQLDRYSHIILTGSGSSVDESSIIYSRLKPLIQKAEREGIPILGICFGFQAIVAALSDFTSIEHYENPEIGWTKIYQTSPSRLFRNIPKKFYAFESHTSNVVHLPPELRLTALSNGKNIQSYEHKYKPIFGVQFHPEYTAHRGTLKVNSWLKHRVPFRWFTNIDMPPRYNPEVAEKIIYNFYHLSAEFKKPLHRKFL